MADRYDTLSTPNYPAIAFAPITGVTAPDNQYPDEEDTDIVIPMHITSFNLPQAKTTIGTVDLMPIINPHTGEAFGGKTLTHAPRELTKLTVEGFIDTPSTVEGEYFIPDLTINDIHITYGDFIAMLDSGQMSIGTDGSWNRTRPLWFRDPYGRVYNNPRILDFSGSYVEQYPGRNNFTMVVKV